MRDYNYHNQPCHTPKGRERSEESCLELEDSSASPQNDKAMTNCNFEDRDMELLEILEKDRTANDVSKIVELNEFILTIYTILEKGVKLDGDTFTLRTTEKELTFTWFNDGEIIDRLDWSNLPPVAGIAKVYRESLEKILEKDKEVMNFFEVVSRSPEEITIKLKQIVRPFLIA